MIYSYWLARLDYDAGQYASAIRRLQDVVAQAPAFARAHDNLGLCYEALNQPDEAIPHYREAVRLNRLDDKAAFGLACAQSRHPAPHARGTGRGRDACFARR